MIQQFFFLQLTCYVPVAKTAELLMKGRFNFSYHYFNFKELAILISILRIEVIPFNPQNTF